MTTATVAAAVDAVKLERPFCSCDPSRMFRREGREPKRLPGMRCNRVNTKGLGEMNSRRPLTFMPKSTIALYEPLTDLFLLAG